MRFVQPQQTHLVHTTSRLKSLHRHLCLFPGRAFSAFALSILLCGSLLGGCTAGDGKQASTSDYPVETTLEDMTSQASYIVRGTFTEKGDTWSVKRPVDTSSAENESSDDVSQLFTFQPTAILKGDLPLDLITISIPVDAQTDGQANHMESAEDGTYIEPALHEEYIVFLGKSEDPDVYFPPFHPWEIRIQDGTCQLETTLNDVKDNTDSSDTYKDTITGMKLEDVLADIEQTRS